MLRVESQRAIKTALGLWIIAGFVAVAGLMIGAFISALLYVISAIAATAITWGLLTGWWLLPWMDKQEPNSRS